MSSGVSGMGPGSATPSVAPTSNPAAPLPASSGNASHHHHHHHGQPPPQRRPKIYCDKWVHEGVCAFTQQGCKYKHEMPFDKLTQHQLGLFHGYPAWWKKHQAELSRQRDVPVSVAGSGPGGGGEDSGRMSNADRFLGRAAIGSGSSTRPSSAAGGGGGGEVVGVASSPVSPGIPNWRRGGEPHPSDQKSLATGRGVSRGVGPSARNFMGMSLLFLTANFLYLYTFAQI